MNLVKLLLIIFIIGLAQNVAVASNDYDADIRYLHVQRGQTLHNIVKRLYPQRAKEWSKIAQDIVRHNPHAFVNNDPTRMRAGVRLELPQKLVVRSASRAKKQNVGVVIESEGSVIAVDQSKISRKISVGHKVYLGDKVITGEKGYVRLKMIDNAVLDLRCFSIMVIEEYALNNTNRRSILNLLQGSLKKVTGEIGKLAEDVYELKTPIASIGVRGTEYALRVFQSKGCGGKLDADDGLYLKVIKGLVDVHNVAGSEVIAKGETAYVPLPTTAPRKIKIKPGVIEPVKVKVAPVPVAEIVKKPVVVVEEESSSVWWWLLGAVGIALLI